MMRGDGHCFGTQFRRSCAGDGAIEVGHFTVLPDAAARPAVQYRLPAGASAAAGRDRFDTGRKIWCLQPQTEGWLYMNKRWLTKRRPRPSVVRRQPLLPFIKF